MPSLPAAAPVAARAASRSRPRRRRRRARRPSPHRPGARCGARDHDDLPPRREPEATPVARARLPQPAREVVTLTLDGRAHPITSRRVVIGRSRECDLRIADGNASRRHAEIVQEGTDYVVVDLGSTNGTELNGRRVTREDADRRRPHHDRRDGPRLRPLVCHDVIGALDTEQTLLALKIGFLVLLYLFIWAVVRSVTRDLRAAPQESIVLSADGGERAASALRARRPDPVGRMLVLDSPALQPGTTLEVKVPTRLGRGGENAIRLDGDDFVSTRHALLEPRPDGLWVEDVGSTNGTFVNGARVTTARLLAAGRRRPDRADRSAGWRRENRPRERAHRHRPAAAPERGHVRLRPPALRGRGRRRRRPGGRDRLAARGGRARGASRRPRWARRRSQSSSARRTTGSTSTRSIDPAAAGMGTVVTAAARGRGRRHDRDRPRRRLARLPAARRRPRAAHARPLPRRRARPRRTAVRRGGRAASAPVRDHAGRRHRAGRRGRDADRRRRARRPLPDLLRRAHRHRPRRPDRWS